MFAWWAINKDYWRNCIPSYFFISVFKCCFNIFFFICSQTIKHTDSAAGLIKTKSRCFHVSDWSHAASSSSFIANSESRIVTVFVTVHVCCLFSVYFCVALMFTFMFLIFIFFYLLFCLLSGTASRLSRKSSYHHCTLLHSADRSALSSVLRPSCPGIQSNATPSVPSPVANLLDHAPSLQWEELLGALVQQYNTGTVFLHPKGYALSVFKRFCFIYFCLVSEFGLHSALTVIDPTNESMFPGVGEMEMELRSWDWTFGKTPKFTMETQLELTNEQPPARCSARLQMEVKNGQIESCHLDVPVEWVPVRLSSELSSVLIGERFCPHRAAAAFSVLLRSESGATHTRLHRLCDAMLLVMGWDEANMKHKWEAAGHITAG